MPDVTTKPPAAPVASASDLLRLKRSAFQTWLDRCQGTTFAHGHDLVLALMLSDNVYEADKTLEIAERLDFIRSMGCKPSPQQKFFGVGGMRWNTKMAEYWEHHRSTHGWTSGSTKLIDVLGGNHG